MPFRTFQNLVESEVETEAEADGVAADGAVVIVVAKIVVLVTRQVDKAAVVSQLDEEVIDTETATHAHAGIGTTQLAFTIGERIPTVVVAAFHALGLSTDTER